MDALHVLPNDALCARRIAGDAVFHALRKPRGIPILSSFLVRHREVAALDNSVIGLGENFHALELSDYRLRVVAGERSIIQPIPSVAVHEAHGFSFVVSPVRSSRQADEQRSGLSYVLIKPQLAHNERRSWRYRPMRFVENQQLEIRQEFV